MKGGKRNGAGRPSKNSVRKNVTLPASYFDFVENNNLSLSKLAQQKIEKLMSAKKNNMAAFYDNFSKGDLVELNYKRALILDIQDVQELKEYSFGIVGEAEVKQVIFHPDGTSFETSEQVSINLLF